MINKTLKVSMSVFRPIFLSVLAGFLVSACGNPYYKGPVTDHFDGTHFSAPEPVPNKTFLSVLKWRLKSERATWANWVDYDRGVTPVDRVSGKTIKATFINHSTFLLQTADLNILTDPIWSERASPFSFMGPKRVHAPGVDFDQLPRIDVVLISHSHYDHMDIQTIKNLVKAHDPLFIVPLGVDTVIHNNVKKARTRAVDWSDSVDIGHDVIVTAEPVQHWSARKPFNRNKTLWASYTLMTPGGNIYFAGDTGYASGKIFKDIGAKYQSFALAMIPIGAYAPRWFMAPSHINPDEAVMIYHDIHAKHAIGMHFGTFQLTDEAMDAPVKDLATALTAHNMTSREFETLKPGMSWSSQQ